MLSMNTATRKYEQRKRAESSEATRLRIVEAAVALHEALGPAQTSISAIAELADVGRPTVYRHFPDERALFAACSGHYLALHPPPEPAAWRAVADPVERLQQGLHETYQWYRETEPMLTSLMRDLPVHHILAETMQPEFARRARAQAILQECWSGPHGALLSAALGHALAFPTWRSLVCERGLDDCSVVDLMTGMVVAATRQPPTVSS